MIFIGEGSLLLNALKKSILENIIIDAVYSPNNSELDFCNRNQILHFQISDINNEIESILFNITDGIIFSLNNAWILKKELLEIEGLHFYNIHNGIIPYYRGKPEICIIYSILNGETEYGVSLHEMDELIDHGKCLATRKFPITMSDDFESVMIKGLNACTLLFNEMILPIVNRVVLPFENKTDIKGTLYTYRKLSDLSNYTSDIKLYMRATNLGLFKDWFESLDYALKNLN